MKVDASTAGIAKPVIRAKARTRIMNRMANLAKGKSTQYASDGYQEKFSIHEGEILKFYPDTSFL